MVSHKRKRESGKRPGAEVHPPMGLELGVPVPARPPELAWVASMRLRWAGATPTRRQRVVTLLKSAAARKKVEQSLYDIQGAMYALYIHCLHAEQIILHLFSALPSHPPLIAVRKLGAEIRKLLESFGPVTGKRRRIRAA